MTPLEYLRREGSATADKIASRCHMPREAVYADLVAAEARGEARVVVHHWRGGTGRWCEWEIV